MMIVYPNKGYQINSKFPNTNFTNDDNVFIIDEATEEGKTLKEKIIKNYPYFDLIVENNNIIDIYIYPVINYTIDKTVITSIEAATIMVSDPLPIQVIIDGVDYGIDSDGVIEYQDENPGEHIIELKAEGYKTAVIKVEVIE